MPLDGWYGPGFVILSILIASTLQEPFSPDLLAGRIREALGAGERP